MTNHKVFEYLLTEASYFTKAGARPNALGSFSQRPDGAYEGSVDTEGEARFLCIFGGDDLLNVIELREPRLVHPGDVLVING